MLGETLLELGQLKDAKIALERSLKGLLELEDQIPKRWSQFGVDAATKRLTTLNEAIDRENRSSGEADNAGN